MNKSLGEVEKRCGDSKWRKRREEKIPESSKLLPGKNRISYFLEKALDLFRS